MGRKPRSQDDLGFVILQLIVAIDEDRNPWRGCIRLADGEFHDERIVRENRDILGRSQDRHGGNRHCGTDRHSPGGVFLNLRISGVNTIDTDEVRPFRYPHGRPGHGLLSRTGRGIALTDMPAFRVHTITSGTEAEGVTHLQERGALVQARAPMLRMSSLHDLERGRRLEVEETLGYVVAHAATAGLAVPTVETCYRLIRGINRSVQGVSG